MDAWSAATDGQAACGRSLRLAAADGADESCRPVAGKEKRRRKRDALLSEEKERGPAELLGRDDGKIPLAMTYFPGPLPAKYHQRRRA